MLQGNHNDQNFEYLKVLNVRQSVQILLFLLELNLKEKCEYFRLHLNNKNHSKNFLRFNYL